MTFKRENLTAKLEVSHGLARIADGWENAKADDVG